MRTSNVIECALQQEIKRCTTKIRIFTDIVSLPRLVTAVLVEIYEKRSVANTLSEIPKTSQNAQKKFLDIKLHNRLGLRA